MSPVHHVEICIDCGDKEALIPFWLQALGYVRDDSDPRGIVDPGGVQPTVWFQEVPEPKTVKDRIHLDLHFTDRASAEARRDDLVAAGGRAVAVFEDFWLMNDPEGNEFCLCWPFP